MKNDENKLHDFEDICANIGSKNLWIIGVVVIALAAFFLFAIFKTKGDNVIAGGNPAGDTAAVSMGGQGMASGVTNNSYQNIQSVPDVATGAQQIAFANQNCPPYTATNPCFTQGPAAQQVAFISPNCMACPTVTQCFPPAAIGGQSFGQGQGVQQVAFQQDSAPVQCPFCGFAYNDIYAAARGNSKCPNCQGIAPIAGSASNGLTTVALPANCMACPTVTQCFPPGQMVALTQPIKPPPIFRDAVMPHKFRGVCENCHIVKPDIAISSTAVPPHAYRGVCSNCHTILR